MIAIIFAKVIPFYKSISTTSGEAIMRPLFQFGDVHPDYPVRVINEREARAGAGILLFFGMIAFLRAFLIGDFTMTRLAILAFGLDFTLRVLVNPHYAPSLVIGRFMVRKQAPEYVGASQKRFAWAIGLVIAVIMAFWIIGLNLAGPVAILGCLTCIVLLFLETSFGICVGCIVYNAIWPGEARFCPGGVCDVRDQPEITRIGIGQLASVTASVIALAFVTPIVAKMESPRMPGMSVADDGTKDCTVPDFAKAIGHEAQWKLHNGCS